MKQQRRIQNDLFTATDPVPALAPDLQKRLLPMIEALLTEIVAATPIVTGENGDDEDHS